MNLLKNAPLKALLLLAGLIFLAACSRGNNTPDLQPASTLPVESTPTASHTPDSLPYPNPASLPEGDNPMSSAYPYPNPLPTQPAVSEITVVDTTVYPNPAQAATPAAIIPGGDPTATSPYPAPDQASNIPPTIVALEPTQTVGPPAVETQLPTPTARPTRDIRKELRATDPKTVQLASGKVQLIEFFAFWDATSKAMAPMINGLEDDYEKRMNLIYLDIDDPATKTLKRQLGFRYQPHFFLLDERGSILKQWLGYVEEAELRSALEAALQK